MSMPSEFGRRIETLSTEPATRLNELYRTLLDEPLREEEWALYEPTMDEARGEDPVAMMERRFRAHRGGAFFKTFFSGNVATGKSTEITRLLSDLKPEYLGVRIDIRDWVNPSDLEAHEVLLAIVFAMNEAMAQQVAELDLQKEPAPELTEKIRAWVKETEYVETQKLDFQGEAGWQGLKQFGKGFAASARASHVFSKETRERQRKRFSELLGLTNAFLTECYEVLRNTEGEPEWIVVIEELDKSPNLAKLKDVLGNTVLFTDLQAHLICNIPTAAKIAEIGASLPLPVQQIYDAPVYHPDHTKHVDGRLALCRALERRAAPSLFDAGQRDRLVVASGGNLRTLFRMVARAADLAAIRRGRMGEDDPEIGPIEGEDVTRAINAMRAEYRDRLGGSAFAEANEVSIAERLARLKSIYLQEPGHDVPDRTLVQLMLAGAVQLFNGTVRRAVHPLVVDVLVEQKILEIPTHGPIPGGSI